MKNFINKINKYLIENHPTIWNTKLIWMLSSAFLIHVIFFLLGFSALMNPEMLHGYRAQDVFIENGTIFINVILSILMLVIWLIYLFKNNAFKSFYPTTRLKLFKQFICYLIIIFCSTTFFISYNSGLKTYISSTYDDARIDREIEISNNVALFFSEDLEDYTIDQRRYPEPFNRLHCEIYNGSLEASRTISNNKAYPSEPAYISTTTDTKNPKKTKEPYLSFLDYKYSFYTLRKKEGTLHNMHNDSIYKDFVYYTIKDTIYTYYYKDSIFDVSNIIKTAHPSYYSHSKTFYISKNDTLNEYNALYDYDRYYDHIDYKEASHYSKKFSIRNEIRNKKNHELLKRNDSQEIKLLLTNFLSITNQYQIKHNLTVEKWFDLIYYPNDFELKSLIRNEPKREYQYTSGEVKNASEEFYKNHITDYYLENNALHNTFKNIENIKASHSFLESIHFFMWFSFFFSLLVFAFRITGLKPLLFTIISVSILAILVGLLTVFVAYTINLKDSNIGYFASYLTLTISTIILLIPIFYPKKIKKLIVAICLNTSIIGFTLYVLLIIAIISLHQSDACGNRYFRLNDEDCFNLLGDIGILWSFILFIIGLIFIYFYANVIKNWKALPEG